MATKQLSGAQAWILERMRNGYYMCHIVDGETTARLRSPYGPQLTAHKSAVLALARRGLVRVRREETFTTYYLV
jgi:hypothetical protein